MKRSIQKPTYMREIKISYKKKRVKANAPVGKIITDAGQIVELFCDMQDDAKEKLITISLNSKLYIIAFEIVAMGSFSGIYTTPFEAIRSSISLSAHGVIMVHNHPSGDPTPSPEDKKFTRRLNRIMKLGGAILHDHIIIGEDKKYFSFSNEDLIR